MGTTQNSTSYGNVLCAECGKGYYKPVNPKSEINYCFVCDNCGSHWNRDPAVEVN